MKLNPHPGYEALFNLSMTDQVELNNMLGEYRKFDPPEDLDVYDSSVPGINGAPDVTIRVYKKKGINNAPLLLNIHGGGFVAGDLDNDNIRCAGFALNVPCVVISVAYRLAPESPFPAGLEDCYAALLYVHEHADEFDIDPERIAIFGTSAGGCIGAGLCLYLRDKGGPKISMQMLNFPAIECLANTTSAKQLFEGSPMVKGDGLSYVLGLYLGGFDGTVPSYYAVPGLAKDLSGLPPAFIVTCEYDPLRDEGIDYARRLLEFAVPTELHSMPRVCHGYDLITAPLTMWIREGMYMSLRREFGTLK